MKLCMHIGHQTHIQYNFTETQVQLTTQQARKVGLHMTRARRYKQTHGQEKVILSKVGQHAELQRQQNTQTSNR